MTTVQLQQQLTILTSTKLALVDEIRTATKLARASKPTISFGRKKIEYKTFVYFPIEDASEKSALYRKVSALQKRLHDVEASIVQVRQRLSN